MVCRRRGIVTNDADSTTTCDQRTDFCAGKRSCVWATLPYSTASEWKEAFYPKPFLQENQFGKAAIHYYTVGQQTRKWEVTSTYGGKMTENIVQAIARDCLAETLRRIEKKGLQVVFHVHDEVIIDAPMDVTVDEICSLMAEPITWRQG